MCLTSSEVLKTGPHDIAHDGIPKPYQYVLSFHNNHIPVYFLTFPQSMMFTNKHTLHPTSKVVLSNVVTQNYVKLISSVRLSPSSTHITLLVSHFRIINRTIFVTRHLIGYFVLS